MSIKLQTATVTVRGEPWTVCCNMNVLADVQDAYDGNLLEALDNARGLRATLEFLAAMLNDAADTAGREERFTAKELGRELTIRETIALGQQIFPLIESAVRQDEPDEETEDAKN